MRIVNLFDIESPLGLRSFKLMEGDITRPGFPIDLVVASAYKRSYIPIKGSIFASLKENLNITIPNQLRADCIDKRSELGCLLMPTGNSLIKNLLILEMKGVFNRPSEAMESLYLMLCLLESRGVKIRNLALPPLGTGLQQFALDDVMHDIITFAKKSLNVIPSLEQILLVSNEADKTLILDQSMNQQLGRPYTNLPISDFTNNLKTDICNTIDTFQSKYDKILSELKEILRKQPSPVLDLAIASRKLLETITTEKQKEGEFALTLFHKIALLKDHGIAPWTISYMHLLRIFSNEYAHYNKHELRRPPRMLEEDITIALFALQRVIDFIKSESK